MYSIFHILMTKTKYGQLDKLNWVEKKIEKNWVNPIATFNHKYMKWTMIQFKSKRSIHLTLEKFLIEFKGKLGQSSVNGLLNK